MAKKYDDRINECIICKKKIYRSSSMCRKCYLKNSADYWDITRRHFENSPTASANAEDLICVKEENQK